MADKPKDPKKKSKLRATQVYATILDRGNGKARISQAYVTVLDQIPPPINPRLRASQVYLTMLDKGPGLTRLSQFYVTILDTILPPLPPPIQETQSMGAIADLLAAPKTFAADSRLAQWLAARAAIVDEAIPASHDAVDEVQSIAVYDGTVSGGDFTLTVALRNGETFTTAAIAFDANAATIETAIDTAADGVVTGFTAGDIAITGGDLGSAPVVLTFSGDSVAGQNHVLTVIDGTGLTGGGTAGAVSVTDAGQTVRAARAVMLHLGLVDATLPDQGAATAPVAGPNLLNVPPWVVRELAQELAFEDGENSVYDVTVTALLGFVDQAPLVAD